MYVLLARGWADADDGSTVLARSGKGRCTGSTRSCLVVAALLASGGLLVKTEAILLCGWTVLGARSSAADAKSFSQ